MGYTDEEKKELRREFADRVNMPPKELEDWLETEQSRHAGWKPEDGGESVGHESGRRIVAIKRKNKDALTEADYDHMRKVIGYVKRHLAQRPQKSREELEEMTWTHSLRNWGHDPLRD